MSWESLASKLLFLGIPFLLAMWLPKKSRKEIDEELEGKLNDKFGKA